MSCDIKKGAEMKIMMMRYRDMTVTRHFIKISSDETWLSLTEIYKITWRLARVELTTLTIIIAIILAFAL